MSINPNLSTTFTNTINRLRSLISDQEAVFSNLDTILESAFTLATSNSAQTAAFMNEGLEAGTIQFVSGLEQDGIEVPSHPQSSLINRQQLKKKIEKAGSIHFRNHQPTPPGCSVLFSLLLDDVQTAFENLMMDPKVRQHLSQQLQVQDQRGKVFISTIRDLVKDHLGIVNLIAGRMVSFGIRGGGWHHTIGIQRTDCTPALIQQEIIDQENLTRQHAPIMDIQKFPSGQAYLDACAMFLQVMICEPNKLLKPLSPNPSLKNHHERLLNRLKNMSVMIGQCTELRNLPKEARLDAIDKENLKTALSMMQRFRDEAETVLKERKNNHSDFNLVYRFIEKWAGAAEAADGEFSLYHSLSLLTQNVEQDPLKRALLDDNRLSLQRHLQVLFWMYRSLLDEMALCSLSELIQTGKSGPEAAQSALVNLKDVVRTIQETSRSEIEGFLDQEGANQHLKANLKNIWERDFCTLRERILSPLLTTISLRLERLEQTDTPVLETALAFREVLMIFGGNVQRAIAQTKENLGCQQLLLQNLPDEDPHRKAYLAMNDLLLQNEAALKAITDRVAAIIANGIEEIGKEEALLVQKSTPKGKGKGQKEINKEVDILLKSLGGPSKAGKKKGKAKPAQPKRKGTPTPPAKTEKVEAPKEVKAEAPVFDSAPEIHDVSALSTSLPSLRSNLLRIDEQLPISGFDVKFRAEWRQGQVENALTLIRQIEELDTLTEESNAIIGFEQIDLSRRLAEAVLEILLASFPVGAKQLSILREASATNHRLHIWIRELLKAEAMPAAVRQTAWQLREVPYLLSDANACVNYPHNTFAEKERMHPRSRRLLDFLMNIDHANSGVASNLQQQSIYFADCLLQAALHPEQIKIADLSAIKELLPREIPVLPLSGLDSTALEAVEESAESTPALEKVEIRHRKEAQSAMNSALSWINIRILAPVQGRADSVERTKKRDQALKNAATHLTRLKEHLDKFRFNRPHLTLLCQMELCRRAHKELHIAALYHTPEGSRIADQQRFCNNPLILSRALKDVSRKETQLPRLSSWLSAAHQVASYPVALTSAKKQGFEVKTLRKLVAKVREMADKQSPEDDGFTLVGGSKRRNRDENIRNILKSHERARTFPALEQILELLRKGF